MRVVQYHLIMNLVEQLFLIFILSEVCWSKPVSLSFNDLIDTSSLQNVIQDQTKKIKILDFQSLVTREFSGYINGSILVPDCGNGNCQTLEKIQQLPDSIQGELFFDETKDKGTNVIAIVPNKDNLKNAMVQVLALGYLPSKVSVRYYAEGIGTWLKAGGAVEFPRTIHFAALQASIESNSVLLIDVRNRSELNSPGQIPKSVCVPLHEILNGAFKLSTIEFQDRYGFEKPMRSDIFVLTCRSGRRILVADNHLKELGYQNIRIYPGSFNDWAAHGGRIVKSNFNLDYELF